MKSKRHLAIQRAKNKTGEITHLPELIDITQFRVNDMNLKGNLNTLLKRASIFSIWKENPEFKVQIELVLYDDSEHWIVEYCSPIDEEKVTFGSIKLYQKRMKELQEYTKYIRENKEKIIAYLLYKCEETKDKLAI